MARSFRHRYNFMVLLVICGLAVFLVQSTKNKGNDAVKITPSESELSCLPNYLKGARQDDPRLIECIRKQMMNSPSPHPYNLTNPNRIDFSQFEQSRYAHTKFLHGMKSGFFVEAGAVDGEYLSNSLYFERELGWRGLLVEPHPQTYKKLLMKNRNAYAINVALSLSPEASEVKFSPGPGIGELSHLSSTGMKITAIPLFSLLKALNVFVVDFLSLDIEAYEVKVLKTIPWDKVKFRLMCIEVNHIPEGLAYLTDFLTKKGYVALGARDVDAWFGWPELLNSTMKL